MNSAKPIADSDDGNSGQDRIPEPLQNEHFIQRVTDAIPQALYIFDISQERVVYINAQITEILGYSVDEVCDLELQVLLDKLHPDDRYLLLNLTKRCIKLADHEALKSEFRLQHKDGQWRWLGSRKVVFSRDANGLPCQILGSIQDITDRKDAEVQLRQSEIKLREAQRLAYVGTWELEISTQKFTWSEETFHILGLDSTQPELTYSKFFDLVYPDDVCPLQQFVEREIEDGISREIDYRIVRSNGSIRYLNLRAEGSFDYQGQVVRLFGVVADVTDRKRLEQLLRSQAERDRLVNAITQRIRQSLDLDEILATAVAQVQQTLQADRVFIFRLTAKGIGSVIKEAVVPDFPAILGTTWETEDFQEELSHKGHPQVVLDAATEGQDRSCEELLQQAEVKSKVTAPIIHTTDYCSTVVWGFLTVHACTNRRVWQPVEIELLQQISNQLAIAIQQSELYQQVQHLNASLEQQVQNRTAELQSALYFEAVLKRITDSVRDSLDETQIVKTAVQELALALHVSCCDTALYNSDKTASTILYDYTPAVHSAQGTLIQFNNFSEYYSQLLRGQYLHFCRVPEFADSIRPDALLTAILACPITDDQGVLGDLWLRKSSTESFSELEIRLVQQVANQCAIAIRQSRLYQAVQGQVEELERLNRVKDDFLSTVSHELRTPMSSIRMAIQMLEIALHSSGFNLHADSNVKSYSSQPASKLAPNGVQNSSAQNLQIARYFQILREQCQREINLIDDLLDLSRLDSSAESLILTAVDIPNWILHVTKSFEERFHKQQQHLNIDVAPDLPPLTTDLSMLERILSELLTNACKYTPSGETITISAQLLKDGVSSTHRSQKDLMDEEANLSFLIDVSNTGVEIPQHECDRVFEKFYRIPHQDPWEHGGTGLGLALVKKLIERLGGTIQLSSAAKRTTFTLRFPQSRSGGYTS